MVIQQCVILGLVYWAKVMKRNYVTQTDQWLLEQSREGARVGGHLTGRLSYRWNSFASWRLRRHSSRGTGHRGTGDRNTHSCVQFPNFKSVTEKNNVNW